MGCVVCLREVWGEGLGGGGGGGGILCFVMYGGYRGKGREGKGRGGEGR